jgi:ElaB/YqjD/DUF883 family membrane-anchored ribosome-binding protein
MTTVSSQQLAADLKAVVNDAEALIKATAGDAGAKMNGVRDRLEESLRVARARVSEIEDEAIAQAKAAARATNEYVHENPWPAIGVAAAASLVIGVLIGRR